MSGTALSGEEESGDGSRSTLSTSCPCSTRSRTTTRPALPLPPVTTILIERGKLLLLGGQSKRLKNGGNVPSTPSAISSPAAAATRARDGSARRQTTAKTAQEAKNTAAERGRNPRDVADSVAHGQCVRKPLFGGGQHGQHAQSETSDPPRTGPRLPPAQTGGRSRL